ncbi:MAG TPA: alpha-E domain-containing protein [Draconibacterium sp.]|nr:alpha-E domain-containing protein [Draconibacterium sp.]HRX11428.1 alpha-E domain-containing protein [Draconibacterium sp.]
MLSRVANNLYWMGRNIERADHLARYSKANYFSSLDAPILKTYDRKFVLESMLYMAGIFDMEDINERDVLFKIGLDAQNPNSIISNVTSARENARGARNAISTDLWEAINKYYHLVINYPPEIYLTTGLFDFSQMISDQTSIVGSKIYATLLHDEEWAMILIGMYIERGLQIIRIINSKLNDIYKIEIAGNTETEMSFEWSNLLRCVESFDMNRKYYRSIPNREQVLEFLMLNAACPRSIAYALNGVRRYEEKISRNENQDGNTTSFKIRKLAEQYKYLSYDEFKDDIYKLLNSTQNKLMEIGSEFEKKYLSF